jgi:hypothetical protein
MRARYPGPAIHLVHLIPAAASLATPSVPLVQAILTRANLPIETIALAVCILDALDSRFALAWRSTCPLANGPAGRKRRRNPARTVQPETLTQQRTPPPDRVEPAPATNGSGRLNEEDPQPLPLHIDSVSPEIIIVAALVLAVKFVDDPQSSSEYFCRRWGSHVWSCEQLNVTERCIMEGLGWRIMPLYDEDLLADAMVDMQLALRHHRPEEERVAWFADDDGAVPRGQPTPEDSDAEVEAEVEGEAEAEAEAKAEGPAADGGIGTAQLTRPSELLDGRFRDSEGPPMGVLG